MASIETDDALLALYPAPAERVRTKKRQQLDDGLRAMLALSPFVLLATADGAGHCDVSPPGGPPGFVKPLDDGRVGAARPERQPPHALRQGVSGAVACGSPTPGRPPTARPRSRRATGSSVST